MGDPAQLPAFEAIDRLGSLTEDWDSYEAPAISPAAREWAKVCLTQIQRHLGPSYGNPLVGPTPEAVEPHARRASQRARPWRRPQSTA